MEEHPIHDMMDMSMQKIKEMVDVNTIVGQPIVTADGTTLIPISKVSFGFASGGADFGGPPKKAEPPAGGPQHFGGGSGAGVNIIPVAFLVVSGGNIRLLTIGAPASTTLDRAVEMVPDVLDRIQDFIERRKAEKGE